MPFTDAYSAEIEIIGADCCPDSYPERHIHFCPSGMRDIPKVKYVFIGPSKTLQQFHNLPLRLRLA